MDKSSLAKQLRFRRGGFYMSLYIIDDNMVFRFKEIMAEQNRLDESNEIVES